MEFHLIEHRFSVTALFYKTLLVNNPVQSATQRFRETAGNPGRLIFNDNQINRQARNQINK
jgi:hypothetical protein